MYESRMSCLDCKFHGPPVSDYTGPKPCAECIRHVGFPKQEPVEKKTEKDTPDEPISV